MVNAGLFAKIAREFTIRQLPTITVFYEDVHKLPKISTTYFTKQFFVPEGARTNVVDPDEMGTVVPSGGEGKVVTVNWNCKTYEKSYTEKNINLKSLDVKNYFKNMVEATNKQLARELDKVILDRIRDAAIEIAATDLWFDGTKPNPTVIDNDIVHALNEMTKSPFWIPDLLKSTVLYLPQNMSVAMKKHVNDFNVSVPVEQVVKKYIGEIKYTPALKDEAILMIKNDEFGAIMVEHEDSPLSFIDQTPIDTTYYVNITMDVQVVPETDDNKTHRIIKIKNIEAE